MTSRTAARLGWSLWALCVAVTVAAIVLLLLNPARTSIPATISGYVATLIFPTVGVLVAAKRPSNPIGWMLLAVGLLYGLGFSLFLEYTWYSVGVHDGTLPLTNGLNGATQGWWAPGIGLIAPFTLLLFPDGHLPSRRWRAPAWAAGIGIALVVISSAFGSDASQSFPGAPSNPFATALPEAVVGVMIVCGLLLFMPTIPASAVAVIMRLRRSRGEERDQLKWFTFGGTVLVASVVIGAVLDSVGHPEARSNVIGLGVLAVPISVGIAILRNRLYDIDLVISKTVVFALLGAFITAVYVAVVVGIGALVRSGGGPVLSAVAAAIVAVAFQPIRQRAQHVANRLVYGKRATPYEVLSEFSNRVSGTYSTQDVLPRMVQILAEGTGAVQVCVWLRIGDELRPTASWPTGTANTTPQRLSEGELPAFGPSERAFPVNHQGDLLGAITLSTPQSETITPSQEKLVRDLASQAGLVLSNVRLIEELRASRQRLVSAQDEERRKIERNIHDGAQQQLVALSVQAKLLQQLIDRDAEKAKELAASFQVAATDALDDLRDLARGIYPPLLADKGLAAALEAQARKAPFPVEVDVDGIERYAQDAEAAVYFCVLEALQNVAKYAKADRVTVRLAENDDSLSFTVTDDGAGFDPAATGYGTGMQGMADRMDAIGGTLHIQSQPGEGTTVTGRIPAQSADSVS